MSVIMSVSGMTKIARGRLISKLRTVDLMYHHIGAVHIDNGQHFHVADWRHLHVSRVVDVVGGSGRRPRRASEEPAERPPKLVAHRAVDEEVDRVRD